MSDPMPRPPTQDDIGLPSAPAASAAAADVDQVPAASPMVTDCRKCVDLLHQLSQALERHQDPAGLLRNTVQLLYRRLGFLLSCTLLQEGNAIEEIDRYPDILAFGPSGWWRDTLAASGIWTALHAAPRPLVFDLAIDPPSLPDASALQLDAFRQERWQNLVVLPIRKLDLLLGCIVMVNVRSVPDPGTLTTLAMVGQLLGMALDNLAMVRTLLLQNRELSDQRSQTDALNRELTTRQQELVHTTKLAAVGMLAAGVAHEINNPVSIIHGTADQLRRGIVPIANMDEHLGVIIECADRISGIVRNLLQFARPDPPVPTPCDLAEIVEQAVRLNAPRLRRSEITTRVSMAPDLPLVMGRRNELLHVLLNLFTNAEHALRNRPLPREIVITGTALQGPQPGITLEFFDNGCGMTEDARRQVFMPFFTTKPRGEGTGLGLSISASILAAHQAEITVDSVAERYTRFVMQFPGMPMEGLVAPAPPPPGPSPTSPTSDPTGGPPVTEAQAASTPSARPPAIAPQGAGGADRSFAPTDDPPDPRHRLPPQDSCAAGHVLLP